MTEQTGRDGQRVGNYRLVRLLGRGGFADVYLAEHLHLTTQAAVKLLNTRLANEGVEGFRNEARMIAGLVHPHIVRVLDFGVENNVPYLVMDYAPNGTLRQRHPKGSRLPLQLVVSYMQQIGRALQYAHDQRLIHRDVKPENMLIGRNQELLLSDFGIALVAQSSQYQHTQNIAGTLAYMAPEQIQAHPRPASDQYALGIVAYEWLGGQRPFQGTMTEVAIKHATAAPPPLRFLVPDLPPAVEQVVLTALQKDPHSRFPTLLAFVQALEQASSQISRSFAGNVTPASLDEASMSRLLPPGHSQAQAPVHADSFQHSGTFSTQPISQTNGQPLFTPHSSLASSPSLPASLSQPGGSLPSQSAYSSYSTHQLSSPPQTHPPLPVPPQRRLSRRATIAVLTGTAAAIVGGGLAYSALSSSRNGSSGVSSLFGSPGAHTPTAASTPGSFSTATATPAPGPLMTFNDHSKTIWAVSWSPDGKYIASASDDGTSHIWNVSTRQRLFSYRSRIQPAQSDDGAYSVAWTSKSTRLAVGFGDGTAQIVDLATYQQVGSYDSGTGGDLRGILYAVSISPDGRYLALGGFFSDDIQIFDIVTQRRVRALSGHTDSVWALAWSHNGRYIASGSADGTARVWDWQSGKVLLVYNKQGDTVRAVSWSPDDARIVSGGLSGPVYLWAADSGQTLLTYGQQTDFEVLAVEWSHHGKYIASGGGSDANTHIWNAQNGQLLRVFPSESINGVSWSPDDARLATANNNVVQVWQL